MPLEQIKIVSNFHLANIFYLQPFHSTITEEAIHFLYVGFVAALVFLGIVHALKRGRQFWLKGFQVAQRNNHAGLLTGQETSLPDANRKHSTTAVNTLLLCKKGSPCPICIQQQPDLSYWFISDTAVGIPGLR